MMIPAYRALRAAFEGYADLRFEEFRALPPRGRKAWSRGEEERVRALAARGGAAALQDHYGPRDSEALRVLGSAPAPRAPMPRPELEAHMRALVRSCEAAGWTPARFRAFAAYLDSEMTPAQLVEAQRADRAARALEEGRPAPDDWDEGEAPAEDQFARRYRGAHEPFKAAVRSFLLAGGRSFIEDGGAGTGD